MPLFKVTYTDPHLGRKKTENMWGDSEQDVLNAASTIGLDDMVIMGVVDEEPSFEPPSRITYSKFG